MARDDDVRNPSEPRGALGIEPVLQRFEHFHGSRMTGILRRAHTTGQVHDLGKQGRVGGDQTVEGADEPLPIRRTKKSDPAIALGGNRSEENSMSNC